MLGECEVYIINWEKLSRSETDGTNAVDRWLIWELWTELNNDKKLGKMRWELFLGWKLLYPIYIVMGISREEYIFDGDKE